MSGRSSTSPRSPRSSRPPGRSCGSWSPDGSDLDDRLGDLLPEFAESDKAAITVLHLLTHRGGLWEWQPAWRHLDAEGRALAWLAALPLRYPAGERFAYSDLGFMLLGEIVARVSGLALDQYVRRELYAPLGMADTGFRPIPSCGAGWRRRRRATFISGG